jgi:RNA polymerase sigma-70 factor (sigma-E family)
VRHQDVTSEEFAEFYAASKDRCLRAAVASGLRPAAAEEAVAEAFARAWAGWSKVRTLHSPSAWVVRTAVNADISWWRRRRREVVTDAALDGAVAAKNGDRGDRGDRGDLLDAVRRLPPRQREVVVLRYLLDLDTAGTAAWLGIAAGTVTAHLHHALATLRADLTRLEEPSR